MSTIDQLNTLLASLGSQIGLPELSSDADGFCSLAFDSIRLHLQADAEAGSLLIFTELGALPERDKLVLLEEMLEANVFFSGTGGATLGTLPGGKAFLSQREFVAALEAPEFQALLENFVSVAETWKSRLTEQPEDSLPSFKGIGATNPGQFA